MTHATGGTPCCSTHRLVRDHRWVGRWGPVAERVVLCTGCAARFVEESTTLPGEDDRAAVRLLPVDEATVARSFTATAVELGDWRCPRCASPRADEVEHIYEITRMRCEDCGFTELCDPWEAAEWRVLTDVSSARPRSSPR